MALHHTAEKRAIVFIDGSNWYHKLRLLLRSEDKTPPINFDLRGCMEHVAKLNTIVEIRYYIGRVKKTKGDSKSETVYANQQKLLMFLEKQKIHICLGHVIRYPDGSMHEKGVDVRLAVDMIKFGIDNKYDVAYLVSSDTDLVPAAEECRNLGKQVTYVGSVYHGQSVGLTKACNRAILLQTEDILPFLPRFH